MLVLGLFRLFRRMVKRFVAVDNSVEFFTLRAMVVSGASRRPFAQKSLHTHPGILLD